MVNPSNMCTNLRHRGYGYVFEHMYPRIPQCGHGNKRKHTPTPNTGTANTCSKEVECMQYRTDNTQSNLEHTFEPNHQQTAIRYVAYRIRTPVLTVEVSLIRTHVRRTPVRKVGGEGVSLPPVAVSNTRTTTTSSNTRTNHSNNETRRSV